MGLKKRSSKKKPQRVVYQASLFGFVKPVAKVPISAAKIKKIQELINKKDGKGAAKLLRELREGLEAFSNRISHKPNTND